MWQAGYDAAHKDVDYRIGMAIKDIVAMDLDPTDLLNIVKRIAQIA